jgi:hypothetical protein
MCINFCKFLSLRLVRGASLIASQRKRGRTVAVRQAEHAAAQALLLERLLRALRDRQRAAINTFFFTQNIKKTAYEIFYLKPRRADSSSNESRSRSWRSCSMRRRSWRSCLNCSDSSCIFCSRRARRTLTRSSSSLRSRFRCASACILFLLWYASSISIS